jgi:malate permease and related proteins
MAPALVFHALATTELTAGVSLRIVGVMLATFAVMYVASSAWSFAVSHDRSMRAGFALAATMPNTGNMGLPVALFAFGQPGLEIAVLNFVLGALLAYTAGIAIASMADGSPREALSTPFRYPALYAAGLGVAINAFDIPLPFAVEAATSTIAAATVPLMLVVLGLQLQTQMGSGQWVDSIVVNAGRLLIAPAVAWFVATAIGLDGSTRATLVVLSAMPTAVIATVLATEFRAQPGFVTRIVVSSTLLSIVTITVLIAMVR